jgi:TolB-like protein/DNA-binding winged helix-turn-helix (wHTH) protein
VSSSKFRFDGWVLDPESGDLERGGTRIRLQEQPVQVLRELIAHAGSVVTREQLIALLWPKGVVDFDTGLNTVIRKLRSALGDTSETPRYIETLPRRGYRFIGALDPEPKAASAISPRVPVSTASEASPAPAPPAHEGPTALAESALATAKPMSSGHEPAVRDEATSSTATTTGPVRRPRLSALALIAALAVAAVLTGVYALWRARSGASVSSVRVGAPSQSGLSANVAPTGAVAFSPPPHSIAVLPFVNLSGDKEQEYFSDGLTEELLNSLTHIEGLQVAARTSSFSFREHPDIADVSRKLNVGAVLEGSVRRSAHRVRVTAQLINGVTGFHLWSETYDRDLGDVLKLQTEIASAVASALKITLLRDVATEMKAGGTRNPAAYDAYLRSASAYWQVRSASDNESVRAGYQEAVRLDPNFALAYAEWSIALNAYASLFAHGPAVGDFYHQARAAALKAIALAPDLAEGHLALAVVQQRSLEFREAIENYERALALAPGNARVLRDSGAFAVAMGHSDSGLAEVRRAVVLDPLHFTSYEFLGGALLALRRYPEAITALKNADALRSTTPGASLGAIGNIHYLLGDFTSARSTCEQNRDDPGSQFCLALAYDKLGRHGDAEAELKKFQTASGDAGIYTYAQIYAQWGNRPKALESLDTAMRWRDPNLENLKTDPLLDPLRQEPRFQAVLRELKFPN